MQPPSFALHPPGLALPARRPSPAAIYWLTVLLLFGPASGFYLLAPLGTESPLRDGWHHVAVLRELMRAPFEPLNPHVATGDPSRYFGPITLALALTGRALGLGVWQVFGLGAVLSLAALALGIAAFARRYLIDACAPLILLLCLAFAWGGHSPSHTGFHNLRTLWVSAGYPASMLFGVALLMWSAALDLAAGERLLGPAAALAALTAVAVLTHQLGAGFAIGGVFAFSFSAGATSRGRTAVAGAVFIGLIMAGAWPYFDPYAVLASVGDPQWRSDTLDETSLGTLLVTAGFALLGVAGLYDRTARRIDLPLALALLGLVTAWAIGSAAGSPVAHRLPPMIIFFLQVGLAAAIVRHRRSAGRVHPVMLGVAAMALLYVLLRSVTPLVAEHARRVRDGDPLAALAQLDAALPYGAVLIADDQVVYPVQSTGHRVVSIPRPEPTVPDLAARQASTARFFAAATANRERQAIARRYGASFAAFSVEKTAPSTRRALAAWGSPQRFGDVAIVAVPAQAQR